MIFSPDVDVLEGAVGGDPYMNFNPDDSSDVLFPSMSTFRSTGSDDPSLGDLGPHGGVIDVDRLYDLPPDCEYFGECLKSRSLKWEKTTGTKSIIS